MLEKDSDKTGSYTDDSPPVERRSGQDRRCGHDQRSEVRYEPPRRKGHGRRKEDKDPWKQSLDFE